MLFRPEPRRLPASSGPGRNNALRSGRIRGNAQGAYGVQVTRGWFLVRGPRRKARCPLDRVTQRAYAPHQGENQVYKSFRTARVAFDSPALGFRKLDVLQHSVYVSLPISNVFHDLLHFPFVMRRLKTTLVLPFSMLHVKLDVEIGQMLHRASCHFDHKKMRKCNFSRSNGYPIRRQVNN